MSQFKSSLGLAVLKRSQKLPSVRRLPSDSPPTDRPTDHKKLLLTLPLSEVGCPTWDLGSILYTLGQICKNFLQISCFFSFFCRKNTENDQRLGCAAPKSWSNYTTVIISEAQNITGPIFFKTLLTDISANFWSENAITNN